MNLSVFNNNLFAAGTELFKQLGIPLNSNTASSLEANKLLRDNYKDKGIFQAIDETYFLGLVDDSVFAGKAPLLNKEKISLKEAEDRLTAGYNGLMVFAVRLKDSYSPTRGEIAELTRAFNRVSKSVPVVLLLKYGGLLSFAASERTKYKQAWREGEKIGKISLLKDINIDAPHTGHLKILEDLKAAPAVNNFNALYKQWQEVFNVQLLNKKFYQELFYWYLWAVKKVKFPQIRPKEDLIPDEAHQSESVIRLLTRLLFCWFMKEKQKLIPELLFDKREVKKILNDFSPEKEKSSVFYRAILQNLFFATLSVPIEKRKYIRESFQGKNKDYGNPYVYRYQSEFADAKENLKLFRDIPFLNGGLFECLDEAPENDNEKEIRLDGFSSKEKKQAFVPDYIFWDEHRGIDLSEELDKPQKKNETVHGIIDILNSYKFTIEENTPLEEEIALDPELLGKVFESLLAYYNPETKANARKQTGSFYTPREIVNYMVDESLFAAFQQKLSDAGITENIEQRLRNLISYNKNENPFTDKETNVIIHTLENLKVLDPACGSGAFPMGILHKLVWILQKVDPENKKWFESIIKRLPDYAQSEMRKKLEGENWDYLRKLGIIQQSIYGVDIQPIAIQIAKLRFFISLLVDQDIKGKSDDNFGLMPLPNLDFKLVSANTLIGAPEQSQQADGRLLFAQDEFFDKFNVLTGQYFGAYEPAEKKRLTKKIEKLVSNKVEEKVKQIQSLSTHTDERFSKHVAEKNKALIEQKKQDAKLWESYNNLFKHESVGFFETKYFFPEVKEGFDVVIGNPPYVVYQGHNKDEIEMLSKIDIYEIAKGGKLNAYKLFLVKSLFLFKEDSGILCFIFQNSFLADNSASTVRKYVLENKQIIRIDSFPERDDTKKRVFEPVKMSVCILLCKNISVQDYSFQLNIWGERWMENKTSTSLCKKEIKLFDDKNYVIPSIAESDKVIFQKFYNLKNNRKAGDILECIEGELNMTFHRQLFNNNSRNPKIIKGAQVQRYYITDDMSQGIVEYLDKNKYLKEFQRSEKSRHHRTLRIVLQGITGVDDKRRLVMTLLSENLFCANSCNYIILKDVDFDMKYILGLLNSTLLNWIFKKTSTNSNVNCYEIEQLCIPRSLPIDIMQDIKKIVDQILAAKQNPPSPPFAKRGNNGADTFALEKQIDEMVYALYGLTPEEIAIVEGRSADK